MAVETVEQIVYMTTSAEKYNVLYNLITSQEHERIMVFTNMKSEARRLYERLMRNDINCTMLTGDVPQQKRMSRLESFRDGKSQDNDCNRCSRARNTRRRNKSCGQLHLAL